MYRFVSLLRPLRAIRRLSISAVTDSKRNAVLQNIRVLVNSLDAGQLYRLLEDQDSKENSPPKISLNPASDEFSSIDKRSDVINTTAKICILEGIVNGSIHHSLACDVVEVLDLYMPSVAQIGYNKLLDICTDNNMSATAIEIFNRSQQFNISIDNPCMERLISLLGKEFNVQLLLNTLLSSNILTANMLISLADPLIMTGNVGTFSLFLAKYLQNQNANQNLNDLNLILRSIVFARIKRVSSLTILSEDEINNMDNILNDINSYHHLYTSNTQNNPSYTASVLAYSYLCEIERLIRDRVDISQTIWGKIFLPLTNANAEFLVEDRDVQEHYGTEIQDITSEFDAEEKGSRKNLMLFEKSIWMNRLDDESRIDANSTIVNVEFVSDENNEEGNDDLMADGSDEDGYDEDDEDVGPPQWNTLGKSSPLIVPIKFNDISATLQKQTPAVYLGFAEDIFRLYVSFTSSRMKKTNRTSKFITSLPQSTSSQSSSSLPKNGDKDDGDGGGVSSSTATKALKADKDDRRP
eukprot:gene5746-11615_t